MKGRENYACQVYIIFWYWKVWKVCSRWNRQGWYNSYCSWKWTLWTKFKCWMSLLAFHSPLFLSRINKCWLGSLVLLRATSLGEGKLGIQKKKLESLRHSIMLNLVLVTPGVTLFQACIALCPGWCQDWDTDQLSC